MNFLLIWLILFKTKKSMRIWSWLLLQTAFIDLANLLVFFVAQPFIFFSGIVVGFYSEGPFGQCSVEIIFLLSFLFLYFEELSKYAIAGQFFYRWMIICRDRKPSPSLYAIAIGIPILFAILPPFGTFFAKDFAAPQQTAASCPKCPMERTVLYSRQKKSIETLFYPFIFALCNLAAYSIILATSFQIWHKSRQSMLADQPHSREFNRQISRVLFIQALIPLVFSLFPTLSISFFIAAGLNIPEFVTLMAFQTWPSVLAPLTTILIVGQYRRYLAKLICKKRATTSGNVIQIATTN